VTFLLIDPDGSVLRIHGPTWPGVLRSLVGAAELVHVTVPDRQHSAFVSADARQLGLPVNVVGTLLLAQWGRPAADALYGPVAVVGAAQPEVVSTEGHVPSYTPRPFLTEEDLAYVEGLALDIARADRGEQVSTAVGEPAWPDAIRLAAAVLRDVPRPAPRALNGAAAVDYLVRQLGLPKDVAPDVRYAFDPPATGEGQP
jgi:hypothetical protein